MNISESLKGAVQNLRRELKRVGYQSEVDYTKVAQGEPEAFLPILHHAFVDFSLPLAKHLTEDCKVHLAGKTDSAFITTLYTVLRDDFAYRPPITTEQFFKRSSFAEKKTIMCIDLLQLVRERHKVLSETSGSATAVRQSMSAVSSKLTSSNSKLVDSSVKTGASSNSIPTTARSTTSTKSNIGPRRSLYIAPTSAKETASVPSLTPLNRSLSLSTEELKSSKTKRSAPASASANVSKEGEGDSQANVSVSNGVRIVVEKHGANVASRRSIAASASGEFKVPLRAVPRPAAKSQKVAPETTPAPTESNDELDSENLPAEKKDRRKTMYASYSSSLSNKLERARRGNARLSIISERKSIEPGDLNVADKENEGEGENKAVPKVSDVSSERSAPLTSLSVTRKDGNAKSAASTEKQQQLKAPMVLDANNNKSKRTTDTKRRDQQPVVVTTIDKTVLETILARLELAETRLRFAERNIDTLLEAAHLPHATPLANTAPVAPVESVQHDAIAQSTFTEAPLLKDAKDISALVETAIKWAAAADAITNASATPQNTDIDASTVPNESANIEGSAQPLNDTEVPFMSEVVVGENAADMTWRGEIGAETL